jgi:hypothetical protein
VVLMPVLVTDAYSRAWRAFRDVAAEYLLHPFDVRVLVALEEASYTDGDGIVEQALANKFGIRRPAVRRSARALADRYLLVRSTRKAKVTLKLDEGGSVIARAAIEKATR